MNVMQQNIEVFLVKPDQLAMVWGQVEPWLDKGEEYITGYYKNAHLFNAINAGMMQLWVGHKNYQIKIIMLTQLDFYPEGSALRFVYMGGERGSFRQIEHLFGKVELWGIEHGANKACVIGRDAWIKKLAKYGYQKRSVVLTKELTQNYGQQWSH